MDILVTAFEAFGKDSVNSSEEAVAMLPREIGGVRIHTLILPVAYDRSVNVLYAKIRELKPACVLCLGQDGGRNVISVERIAINIDDCGSADNDGIRREGEKIDPNGPDAYFATIPVKKIASAINGSGIPASVSNSAGTYVCNHAMYGLMRILKEELPETTGGFVHVPKSASLITERIAEAIRIAIATVIENM